MHSDHYNFLKQNIDQPMMFDRMPAVSIYFRDPDNQDSQSLLCFLDRQNLKSALFRTKNGSEWSDYQKPIQQNALTTALIQRLLSVRFGDDSLSAVCVDQLLFQSVSGARAAIAEKARLINPERAFRSCRKAGRVPRCFLRHLCRLFDHHEPTRIQFV